LNLPAYRTLMMVSTKHVAKVQRNNIACQKKKSVLYSHVT